MSAEIEMKLALPAGLQDQLLEHPLLKNACGEVESVGLYNRYFDTPDRQLNAAAVALRIRRQSGRYIQTLKTSGTSQGGLHTRREWEWELPSNKLALGLLPAEALPEGVDLSLVEPLFSTDFQRTFRMVDFAGARIEVALDVGWVSREGERDPLCELELELKAGEPEALLEFAEQLLQALPLRIARISKGGRGFRLLEPDRARRLPERAQVLTGMSHEQVFYDLFDSLLERMLVAIEGYLFLQQLDLLLPLEQELRTVLRLLDCYGNALAQGERLRAAVSNELDQLQALLAPLQISQEFGSENLLSIHQTRIDAALDRWLESLPLAQMLFQLSLLSHRRQWQPAMFERLAF